MTQINTRPRSGTRKLRDKVSISLHLYPEYASTLSKLADDAGISKANLLEVAIMHLIVNDMIEVSGTDKAKVTIVS